MIDDMKSSYDTYKELTSDFEVCLDLLKSGKLPRIDIPSSFMVGITDFFAAKIKELKDKISEIEDLVKIPNEDEDSDEFEKIILIMDELYSYYQDVAHKVF